jgi:2-polyprenyl-3-methyl-5-hydroxy-6-metoxy-1,4-benzoquinol methylase
MLECSHPLPESQILAGRQGFLLAACAGKTVLHVGCVDSGFARERFALGELLHQRLAIVARDLWGTDVDAEGVRFLLDNGFDHVLPIDLSTEAPGAGLAAVGFDVIVLGEVLEHLPNPGKMLAGVRGLMRPGRTRLIVSVPNAFSLTGLFSFARGVESVHPDHNFYFSRTTLRNLLAKNGLSVLKEYVYVFDVDYLPARRLEGTLFFDGTGQIKSHPVHPSARRLLGRLRRLRPADALNEIARTLLSAFLYRRTPYWADGLMVVCARDDDQPAAVAATGGQR